MDCNTGEEPKRVLVPEVERSLSKLDVEPIPSVLEAEGNATSILKVTAVAHKRKISAAATKSEESFAPQKAKQSATVIKWVGSAAASKSEESFVVPEAKESAAASKSEESFVVPEAKESAAVFRWTGSVAVYEWRESDIPFWLTKTPPVSESKGSGVASDSKISGVAATSRESFAVPEAKGSDVVPKAKGSDVVPKAKGSDVVPKAKGSDVAPKAKGGVLAPTLKGVVPMPSMAESPSNTFNMKDFLGESWTDYDLVMEIGCGDGRATKTFIIRIIKKFWAYYAVDINPKLIKIANERYSHPKLEYRVADIESISTFKPVYLHRFTKIISLNCIHCMKTSQRPAFENIHHLLTKNGVAHILFIISHPFWSVYSKLFQMRKWRKHLKDSSFRVPCSHEFNLGAENYRILLEEIGFIVLYAEDRFIPISFKDVSEFKNSYATFCSQHVCRVPHNLEEAFLQDSLKVFLKFAKRDSSGHWSSQFKILLLRLLKPEISRA